MFRATSASRPAHPWRSHESRSPPCSSSARRSPGRARTSRVVPAHEVDAPSSWLVAVATRRAQRRLPATASASRRRPRCSPAGTSFVHRGAKEARRTLRRWGCRGRSMTAQRLSLAVCTGVAALASSAGAARRPLIVSIIKTNGCPGGAVLSTALLGKCPSSTRIASGHEKMKKIDI